MYKYCKANYFDASALVKLIAEDPDEARGRDALREYYWSNTASVYASTYSVTETLSAFKRKHLNGRISDTLYVEYVEKFLRRTIGLNLRVDDTVSILSPVVRTEAERLFWAHKIDFLDCLQIVTIKHGQFQFMEENSKSILITADRALAQAARSEDVKVWECTAEPAPRDVVPAPYLV
jgi:predicted nucleic acid-binding protein